MPTISIVVVTFNRLHLLRQCVERVLARTSSATVEIIIWDNACTDGSREYLAGLRDPRIRVIHHDRNIGTNAYARAFPLTSGNYLLELDDDVIDAPQDWDRAMMEAMQKLPTFGYLAAHVVDDGRSTACEILYRKNRHLYQPAELNGVELLIGPTGGWCSMTPRAVYDAAGGFKENSKFVYWFEDAAYIGAVHEAGFRSGILASLKVFHAAGDAYSKDPHRDAARASYFAWLDHRQARRDAIKRVLERIPPCRWLNGKLGLYRIVHNRPSAATIGVVEAASVSPAGRETT